MARVFNDHKTITKNRIDSYTQQTSDYSRYLQGAPTFVKYYKKDHVNSTADTVLDNVKQVIGNNSPIKFHVINDFPLYGFETVQPNVEVTDFGLDLDMNSEAIILPDTIRPVQDEFFSVEQNGVENLFRIMDVSLDRIKGKPYYRVTYELDESNDHNIETQVSATFNFIYENLGTEQRTILESEEFLDIKKINQIKDKVYDYYADVFTSNKFNTLLYPFTKDFIYNRYLIKFIVDNDIFYRPKSFYSAVMINDVLGDHFQENYLNTIYYAIENKTDEYFNSEDFLMQEIAGGRYNHFSHYRNNVYNAVYIPMEMVKEMKPGLDNNLMSPHGRCFATHLKLGTLYNCPDRILEDLIITYIKFDLKTDILIDKIFNLRFTQDISTFLLLPCIMFIIDEKIKGIMNKELRKYEGRY